METKRCCHCGVDQPTANFNKGGPRAQLYPVCKTCRAAAFQARKARDPEGIRQQARERMRRWREKPENMAKDRVKVQAWREAHPQEKIAYAHEYNQRSHVQRGLKDKYTRARYGITVAEYEALYSELMQKQLGLCAACDEPAADGRYLHMDHDHTTGRIRALLCGNCNQALGLLHEDLGRIAALFAYAESCQQEGG